jgi:serpin B
MATAMHFTLPPDDLFAAQDALDLALASRATDGTSSDTRPFELHTANSIWGQTGKSFVSDFLDTLAVNYGAGLYVLDFADDPEAARGTINDWVAQQTHDKITDVLPDGSITNNTALVLTNAIYFNAAWAKPFDASETADRPFAVGGTQVSVSSVHGISDAQYAEGDGWKAGELPYDGGKLAMDIIVPDDLAAFESTLTAAQLAAITGGMQPASLETTLPKFSFSSPFDLGDALKALGMTDAFTYGAADFSGIDGMLDLFVAKVLHKGFVAVDETGTEAAAATAVVVEPGSAEIPSHTLTVDKPFVFLIRDLPTGEILFVGRVTDPRS